MNSFRGLQSTLLEHTHQNGEQKCVLLGRRGGTCLYLTHFAPSVSLVAADLSEQLLGKHEGSRRKALQHRRAASVTFNVHRNLQKMLSEAERGSKGEFQLQLFQRFIFTSISQITDVCLLIADWLTEMRESLEVVALKLHESLLERGQIIFFQNMFNRTGYFWVSEQFPVDCERPQWAGADLNSIHGESAVLDPTETMGSASLQPVVQICLLCAG